MFHTSLSDLLTVEQLYAYPVIASIKWWGVTQKGPESSYQKMDGRTVEVEGVPGYSGTRESCMRFAGRSPLYCTPGSISIKCEFFN